MTSWIIGSGGLLGSAVTREIIRTDGEIFDGPPIPWGQAPAIDELSRGLHRFVSANAHSKWRVYWCAGAAVTDSGAQQFAVELHTFQTFLDAIAALPESARQNGSIVYASSAGGVYGGGRDSPFDEDSPTAALGQYGESKLAAEAALDRLATRSGIRVLIARIANVYGPGQSLSKRQGLISRLCFSAATRTPISVFVPLDTLRDYIYVDDCAHRLVECASRLESEQDRAGAHVKIIASGRAESIASILGTFRHVSGARPLVVMGWSSASALQGRDLRLRSRRWVDLDSGPQTTLPSGISQTINDMRLTLLQPGKFAPAPRP